MRKIKFPLDHTARKRVEAKIQSRVYPTPISVLLPTKLLTSHYSPLCLLPEDPQVEFPPKYWDSLYSVHCPPGDVEETELTV